MNEGSSGNANRTVWIELIKVAWSPPGKSVRPMLPANSVSPTKSTRFLLVRRVRWPGTRHPDNGPGVWCTSTW